MTLDAGALDRLAGAMIRAGIRVAGALTAEIIAGGRSNVTYRVSDGEGEWALRTPPPAGKTPSAHDVLREFRITEALANAGQRTPRALLSSAQDDVLGDDYALSEWVTGPVYRTEADIASLSDRELDLIASNLIDTLAGLHSIDYARAGLAELGRPDGFAARQVERWHGQWALVATRELPGVDALYRELGRRLPARTENSLVHGDYRIDNAIFSPDDGTSILAVLDWEMGTLGDPLTDVALMCAYRNPAFRFIVEDEPAWTSRRLPDASALVERYEKAAGRAVHDWPFYLGLANLKIAVIAEGIAFRAERAGRQTGLLSAQATPEFIEAGLAALQEG